MVWVVASSSAQTNSVILKMEIVRSFEMSKLVITTKWIYSREGQHLIENHCENLNTYPSTNIWLLHNAKLSRRLNSIKHSQASSHIRVLNGEYTTWRGCWSKIILLNFIFTQHLHGSKLGLTHTHSFDLMPELVDSTWLVTKFLWGCHLGNALLGVA